MGTSIINLFNKTYNFFVNIGIHDNIDFSQKIKIKVINQIFFVGLAFITLMGPLILLSSRRLEDLAMLSFFAIVGGLVFWLNHKRYYTISRNITIFTCFTAGFLTHIVIGNFYGGACMYLTATQLVIFTSDKKYTPIIVAAFILEYILSSFYLAEYGPISQPKYTPFHPIGYVLGCSSILLLIANLFDKESQRENEAIRRRSQLTEAHNEELNRFKYIISHDLKEPVRSIVSFSSLLKRYEDKPEKQKEFTQFIMHSGKQLDQLINSIRDFQEVEQLDIELSTVSIPAIINDINVVLDKMMRNKNAQINYDKSMPKIKTSHYALLSVLKNLIENGIRFNKSEAPKIDIWSEVFKDRLHIYIKDNGIGIEKKYFSDIFVMFKRINIDETRSPGLGLNIARKTINKLGGELEIAYSRLDRGSTFLISFPAHFIEEEASTSDKIATAAVA